MNEPDAIRDAWADGHPDELLSALVDGELPEDEAGRVLAHLERCPDCDEAFGSVTEAARLLRTLPGLDGHAVVDGFLDRHRQALRTGVAFVGLVGVILGFLAVTAAVEHRELVPDVVAMRRAHAAMVDAQAGAPGRVAALGLAVVDDIGSPYAAGAGLGRPDGLERQRVWDGDDLAAIHYGDADSEVLVFQQPGRLRASGLPAGRWDDVSGHRLWIEDRTPVVVVAEVGDLVVTAVARDEATAIQAILDLPDRHRSSTWNRVHDACQRLTRVFALDG